jgi:hypothetical protein
VQRPGARARHRQARRHRDAPTGRGCSITFGGKGEVAGSNPGADKTKPARYVTPAGCPITGCSITFETKHKTRVE